MGNKAWFYSFLTKSGQTPVPQNLPKSKKAR